MTFTKIVSGFFVVAVLGFQMSVGAESTAGFITGYGAKSSENLVVKARGEKGSEAYRCRSRTFFAENADPRVTQPIAAGSSYETSCKVPNDLDMDTMLDMSLEELMDLEVISSGRRLQPIGRSASAVYVITAEDIHQAGVSRLSDIFRMVPGMDIARVANARQDVAMSVRGFAKENSRRLQILLDGRPLYDGFKGGVNLIEHPIIPQNIERIEVIRGNGGVTWGANAVNGVINIITKAAEDTQGVTLYGGVGNRELHQGLLRYGGSAQRLVWCGSLAHNHDNGFGGRHGDNYKDYYRAHTGTGRFEYDLGESGDVAMAVGHKDNTFGRPSGSFDTHERGMTYCNATWEKDYAQNQRLLVRWAMNWYRQENFNNLLKTRALLLEIQHNLRMGESHQIVWGVDYTQDAYDFEYKTNSMDADPASYANDQGSAFIEDEITILPNLWLTLGYRGQYNELSHYGWAAKAGPVWEFIPKHFLRLSWSRAFRRPIMWETFAHSDSGTLGNDALDNEKLTSWELGYRGRLAKNLELNIETFFNRHEDLIGTTNPDKQWKNTQTVKTYGAETSFDYLIKTWWLVKAAYSYEHQTNASMLGLRSQGKLSVYRPAQHKASLTNRFYIENTVTLNTQLYYSDTYYNDSFNPKKVNPYFRFDVRLAKTFCNDTAEIAIGATNLNDHFHNEEDSTHQEKYQIPRQFYVQGYLKF